MALMSSTVEPAMSYTTATGPGTPSVRSVSKPGSLSSTGRRRVKTRLIDVIVDATDEVGMRWI
jgi:hypothetical protein